MTQQYDAFGDHTTTMEVEPFRRSIQRVFAIMKDERWYTLEEIAGRTDLPKDTLKVCLAVLISDPNVLTIEVMKRNSTNFTQYKLIPNKKRLPV